MSPILENSSPPPVTTATTVLGVLGGIASGKSTVARLLAGREGIVIDADHIVDTMYADEVFCARVAEHFGPGVLQASGRIDRAALGRRIFADAEQRELIERWIHPPVREKIQQRLSQALTEGVPRVVLDIPLLLENDAQHNLVAACGALVFVDTPSARRESRALERGWPPGQLTRREATQLPLDEKRRRAQHVIENHGTRAELALAVSQLLRTLALD